MDEKSLLLKRHGCSVGLTDEEIREIAGDCELVRMDRPGNELSGVV